VPAAVLAVVLAAVMAVVMVLVGRSRVRKEAEARKPLAAVAGEKVLP
jgi:hypothetical protein